MRKKTMALLLSVCFISSAVFTQPFFASTVHAEDVQMSETTQQNVKAYWDASERYWETTDAFLDAYDACFGDVSGKEGPISVYMNTRSTDEAEVTALYKKADAVRQKAYKAYENVTSDKLKAYVEAEKAAYTEAVNCTDIPEDIKAELDEAYNNIEESYPMRSQFFIECHARLVSTEMSPAWIIYVNYEEAYALENEAFEKAMKTYYGAEDGSGGLLQAYEKAIDENKNVMDAYRALENQKKQIESICANITSIFEKFDYYYKKLTPSEQDEDMQKWFEIHKQDCENAKQQTKDLVLPKQPNVTQKVADCIKGITLTAEEKTAIYNGAKVELVYQYDNMTPTETEKKMIENIVNKEGYSVGKCFDITTSLKIGEKSKKVTQLGATMAIEVALPKDLVNTNTSMTRKYQVIRIHEGVATVLPATFDEKTGTLSFETDQFSTYVVTYKDVAKTATAQTTPEQTVKSPTTGESSIAWMVLLSLALISFSGVMYRKYRMNEN